MDITLSLPSSDRFGGTADWNTAVRNAEQLIVWQVATSTCGGDRILMHALAEEYGRLFREETTEAGRDARTDHLAEWYALSFVSFLQREVPGKLSCSYGGREGDEIFIRLTDRAASALLNLSEAKLGQLGAAALAWMINEGKFGEAALKAFEGGEFHRLVETATQRVRRRLKKL